MMVCIPARTGSQRVPEKNLQMIGGKTLVEHAIDFALQLNYPIVVTTNSPEVARIAQRSSDAVMVCFAYPPKYHGTRSSSFDVWRHAWEHGEKELMTEIQCSVYLEPSTPIRSIAAVEEAIAMCVDEHYDLVTTVEPVPDRWCAVRQLVSGPRADATRVDLSPVHEEALKLPRQLRGAYYVLNGAAYVADRNVLFDPKNTSIWDAIYIGGVVTEHTPTIDTMDDLEEARRCFKSESTPA